MASIDGKLVGIKRHRNLSTTLTPAKREAAGDSLLTQAIETDDVSQLEFILSNTTNVHKAISELTLDYALRFLEIVSNRFQMYHEEARISLKWIKAIYRRFYEAFRVSDEAKLLLKELKLRLLQRAGQRSQLERLGTKLSFILNTQEPTRETINREAGKVWKEDAPDSENEGNTLKKKSKKSYVLTSSEESEDFEDFTNETD
jgi:hypothetical protein